MFAASATGWTTARTSSIGCVAAPEPFGDEMASTGGSTSAFFVERGLRAAVFFTGVVDEAREGRAVFGLAASATTDVSGKFSSLIGSERVIGVTAVGWV